MSNIADDVPISAQNFSAQRAFLADLRHELRTPLNAIIGYSEMLIEDVQDRDEEDGQAALIRDLETIRAAGAHLLALVNSILDPAHIETAQPAHHRLQRHMVGRGPPAWMDGPYPRRAKDSHSRPTLAANRRQRSRFPSRARASPSPGLWDGRTRHGAGGARARLLAGG
jgi:hypothetical protein